MAAYAPVGAKADGDDDGGGDDEDDDDAWRAFVGGLCSSRGQMR